MDEYIKQSIESRRAAIFASCKVDGEMKKKVDEVFAEIEELGKSCKDISEFEDKFASGPLNQKYMDLFKELAMGAQGATQKNSVGKTIAGGIIGGVASSVASRAIDSLFRIKND